MELFLPVLLIAAVVLYARARARRYLVGRGGLARMSGRAVGAIRKARRQKLKEIQRRLELMGESVEPVELRLDADPRTGEVSLLEELRAEPPELPAPAEPPPLPVLEELPEPSEAPIETPIELEVEPPIVVQEPLEESTEAPVVSPPDLRAIDPADLARELFEGCAGFEAAERFASRARGARVRWSGVVDRVHSVGGLGDDRGGVEITAVVPESRSASGREVRWTCVLPSTGELVLEGAVGRSLEVEGTLDACDPYMWNFTLVEGRLLT